MSATRISCADGCDQSLDLRVVLAARPAFDPAAHVYAPRVYGRDCRRHVVRRQAACQHQAIDATGKNGRVTPVGKPSRPSVGVRRVCIHEQSGAVVHTCGGERFRLQGVRSPFMCVRAYGLEPATAKVAQHGQGFRTMQLGIVQAGKLEIALNATDLFVNVYAYESRRRLTGQAAARKHALHDGPNLLGGNVSGGTRVQR